jgi:hypothetical protein
MAPIIFCRHALVAVDTICKHRQDKVQRGALFARQAKTDDWCRVDIYRKDC